eukprot:3734018-Pyramimonas_sp.AAC.1
MQTEQNELSSVYVRSIYTLQTHAMSKPTDAYPLSFSSSTQENAGEMSFKTFTTNVVIIPAKDK